MIYLIWNRARGRNPYRRDIVTAVRNGVWVATFFDMRDAEAWCADETVWRC